MSCTMKDDETGHLNACVLLGMPQQSAGNAGTEEVMVT